MTVMTRSRSASVTSSSGMWVPASGEREKSGVHRRRRSLAAQWGRRREVCGVR